MVSGENDLPVYVPRETLMASRLVTWAVEAADRSFTLYHHADGDYVISLSEGYAKADAEGLKMWTGSGPTLESAIESALREQRGEPPLLEPAAPGEIPF